jgi:2-hydroxychromene-2-carboxylate isomerase
MSASEVTIANAPPEPGSPAGADLPARYDVASMAPTEISFLFDYASPWSFLANELLTRRFGDAPITFQPVYLRGFEAFASAMPYTTAKLLYIANDFARCAAHEGVAVRQPSVFPINGLHALRGALAARSLGVFAPFHAAMFRAAGQEDRDISDKQVVTEIARAIGAPEIGAVMESPEVKQKLRADTEAASARGAFGVPTFFVGEELFWGHDRMDYVARAAGITG